MMTNGTYPMAMLGTSILKDCCRINGGRQQFSPTGERKILDDAKASGP